MILQEFFQDDNGTLLLLTLRVLHINLLYE